MGSRSCFSWVVPSDFKRSEHATLLRGFLPRPETERILREIEEQKGLLRDVGSPLGLGPRYRVIDGEQVARHFPDLVEYARGRLRDSVEKATGQALELFESQRRAIQVQVYSKPGDGFRWHFDGHAYAAILTLRNTSRGATEALGANRSRWLRLPLYALYPFPGIFSVLPRQRIVPDTGDLVIVPGEATIHRGTHGGGPGERWSIAFNYDLRDRPPRPFRDWRARRINY